MPICEFSGEETDALVTVKIEGVSMRVAPRYAKYGVRVEEPTHVTRVKTERRRIREPVESVRSDAPELLRHAFQKLDTDEESLAKRLCMKGSHFKAYLRGDRAITINDARAFERFFSIQLVEATEPKLEPDEAKSYSAATGPGLTLGDMLRKKKQR
jgi:uncharacterized protein (TIGR00270 family)